MIKATHQASPNSREWRNGKGPLSQTIQAAIIKYHRLGGLNNKLLFLTVLELGKSKIKVPENFVSARDPLPISEVATFSLCYNM